MMFFSALCFGQETDVEVEVITNQPVSAIFTDARGLVYARPLAEPEVLLRFDGNQVSRLGRAEYLAEGLELPAGYEHSKLLKLSGNRVLSMSNPTREVALIELSDLSFTLRSFADIGLKDEALSLDFSQDENKWISVTAGKAAFTLFEWQMDGVTRSFPFTAGGKVRDAKHVLIGDTILLDVYPRGSYYYDWNGRMIKKIGDEDFVGWNMWESAVSYKYFSELKWLPDGNLYTSLRWSFPSQYVFNRTEARFYPAPNPFPSFEGEYVSIPITDSLGNQLYAGGKYYGQRSYHLITAAGEHYDLKEKLQDAILGNRDHTNPQAVVADNLVSGLWVASETKGLLRINFPKQRINHWQRIFGTISPVVYEGDQVIFNLKENGVIYMSFSNTGERLSWKHLFYEHRKKVISGARHLAFADDGWLWTNDYTALMGNELETNAYREIEMPGKIGEAWGLTSGNRAIVGMADNRLLLVVLEANAIEGLNIPVIPDSAALLSVFYDAETGLTWLGTTAGLFYGDPDQPAGWQQLLLDNQSLQVHHFYKESKAQWWLSSDQGWLAFDPEKLSITDQYTRVDGLISNQIRSTVKAKEFYWIGTRDGLSRFNPNTKNFKNFTHEEGLSSRKFTRGSAYLPGANCLVFGTENGLNYFRPEDLMDDEQPVISVSTLTFYQEDSGRVIKYLGNPQDIKAISLPADNRSLEIEFFLENLPETRWHTFAYRLVGRDEEWEGIKNRNRLSSRTLPAGKYVLEVKGKTRFSDWSEPHRIELIVADFFYNTWWFRISLLAVFAGIVGAWIYRLSRESEKLKLKVEERTATIRRDKETIEQQTGKLKELDAAKTRFFANISHELRTPLTVIRGFAHEAGDPANQAGKAQMLKSMGMIEANSDRLLVLVNQLLELSKLEAGKLAVRYRRTDLRPELDLILGSFQAVAQEKKQRLVSAISFPELMMDIDLDKLHKILYNLFSNAVKFSPEAGRITLRATVTETEEVLISVRDTGIGIPGDKLETIFHRFSQLDDGSTRKAEGSGIGLNFARELAVLMGGSLTVESKEGEGSTFTLTLPRWQAKTETAPEGGESLLPYPSPTGTGAAAWERAGLHPADPAEAAAPLTSENSLEPVSAPLLLLVEDNPDIIAYLKLCLGDRYRLLYARDGREGLAAALEHIPDLVISDVMMPVMDGLEMCRELKKDQRSSHIPVILLTALSSVNNRIKGLREGADAYLSKPFVREELEVQIQNLLQSRIRLRRHFLRAEPAGGKAPPETEVVAPAEADYAEKEWEFLNRITTIVTNNLGDPNFRTEQLAKELMLSQSQLWRKIKAVTGLSTKEFVDGIRLDRARALLELGELTVAEVAYAVGFSDPSYFTKRFSTRFGELPSSIGGRRF